MRAPASCLTAAFAAAMDRLGPFEPRPALAVAVSGGADSTALAILARNWAAVRGGSTLALVVDHGLRAASADEARITVERLARLGIPTRSLLLDGLPHGSALAERARIMRYDIMAASCRDANILHLVLGHHAADQVETVAMRVLRGSMTHGLAAMPAVRETATLRLLRPLLAIEPAALRRFLTAAGADWIEDPSNRNMRALRARLRHGLTTHAAGDPAVARFPFALTHRHRSDPLFDRVIDRSGDSTCADHALAHAIAGVGRMRAQEEAEIAAELAARTTIRPEGFALLSPGRIGAAALGVLVRTIGGARYAPSTAQIGELAAQPKPATVAGVRIMPAGRFGDGMLIAREEAAVEEPVRVRPGTIWDHRFRLTLPPHFSADATVGKLGADANRFRGSSSLPAAILRTLPAVRLGGCLAAVPHLAYAARDDAIGTAVVFAPPRPAAGACFMPAG